MGIELLAPAGGPDCVTAAVRSGAGAVYLGLGDFNCRQGAKNFTLEEFSQAVEYCHTWGVKVYVTLNTLVTDRELKAAEDLIRQVYALGGDALLVQDWGVARVACAVAPGLPLHASTQMGVHNLEGVLEAQRLGCTRVVLAREMSREELKLLCAESPLELEVFCHGALCMCYSGQCEFSALVGRRSGNRGRCAQPCRLPYGFEGRADGTPLSLKDLTLAPYLTELQAMGVASLKIEGRLKRPEYVALVTGIFRRLLDERRVPTAGELEDLRRVFSRQGFTDGYYTGKLSDDMFGMRKESPPGESQSFLAQVRGQYEAGAPAPRVGVELEFTALPGVPSLLSLRADTGEAVRVEGEVPQSALRKALTLEEAETRLKKTGGTPYRVDRVKGTVAPDLFLPAAALNDLRRRGLDELTKMRLRKRTGKTGEFFPISAENVEKKHPLLSVQVRRPEQLSKALLEAKPDLLYLPAEWAADWPETVRRAVESGAEVAGVLPRVWSCLERADLVRRLTALRELGVGELLVGNLGGLALADDLGFQIRGDWALQVFNSETLYVLKQRGLLSAAASFELSFPQVRDLEKVLPTELLVYGRLPLMLTRHCLVKNHFGACRCGEGQTLTDRRGERFLVEREYGCRSGIYNGKPLYLADRQKDWQELGLWAVRLCFVDESPERCVQVLREYRVGATTPPEEFTRGLYYRGVL